MTNIPVASKSRLRTYLVNLCLLILIPVFISLNMPFSKSNSAHFPHSVDQHIYPGDESIKEPSMLYNQHITISNSTPGEIFPWLLQLGKGRAGWYVPASWDSVISTFNQRWKSEGGGMAAWYLQDEWVQQAMTVGNRVEDYGIGKEPEWFEVVEVKQPGVATGSVEHREDAWLIYRSERYGCEFTWALFVWEHPNSEDAPGEMRNCTVHLRFRGRIQATGMKKRAIVSGGGVMDHLTTWPMLRGLKERIEKAKDHDQTSSSKPN